MTISDEFERYESVNNTRYHVVMVDFVSKQLPALSRGLNNKINNNGNNSNRRNVGSQFHVSRTDTGRDDDSRGSIRRVTVAKCPNRLLRIIFRIFSIEFIIIFQLQTARRTRALLIISINTLQVPFCVCFADGQPGIFERFLDFKLNGRYPLNSMKNCFRNLQRK